MYNPNDYCFAHVRKGAEADLKAAEAKKSKSYKKNLKKMKKNRDKENEEYRSVNMVGVLIIAGLIAALPWGCVIVPHKDTVTGCINHCIEEHK
jgi:hypothetical protein